MRKKRNLAILLALCLLMNVALGNAVYAFSGSGLGTEMNPYIITTASQLDEVWNDLSAHYQLGDDIDLNNVPFTPIGDWMTPFTGVFDGDGYTISNLTVTSVSDDAGLFGRTDGAALSNVKIENVDVTGGYYCTGALVGYANDTVIENCSVSGTGTVAGDNTAGGLIGRTNADVLGCYATVDVEGVYCVGGLIGKAEYEAYPSPRSTQQPDKIEWAVYQTVKLSGNFRGILGQLAQTGMSSSREDLSYEDAIELNGNYATGHVIGLENVGGFVGGLYVSSASQINVQDCFATGSVTSSSGAYETGGFVGSGSIGGRAAIELWNCYSACEVSENGGGFAGTEYDLHIDACYFDSTVAGPSWNDWQAHACPTEQMKQEITFEGFDFGDTWSIDEDVTYPYLQNLPNPFDSTPPTVPGPVVNVHYTAKTDTTVSLAWNSVSGATSYVVKLGGTLYDEVGVNSCVVTGLNANTSYTFTVYATNSEGDGDSSAPCAVWTNLPAVSGLQQTGATSSSITVVWNALSNANAYDISKDNGLTFTPLGNVTTHTFPGLTASTTYPVIVRGKNANTGGEWSAVLQASTTGPLPPQVTGLQCTAKTDTTVSLTWDSVSGATGGYGVKYGATDVPIANGATTTTITGLSPNTPYSFTVYAKNAAGNGPESNALAVRTNFSAPTNLTSPSKTDTSITLSWGAVSNATSYDIDYNGTIVNKTSNSNQVIPGLSPSTPYTIKVKAKSSTADGEWSGTISVTTNPAVTAPPKVTGVTCDSLTDTTVTLSWDAAVGATGGYGVKYGSTDVPIANGATTTTITGLSSNSPYSFTVYAKNSAGNGPDSNALAVRTNFSAPANLTSPAKTDTSITLSWGAVTNATSYDVDYNGTIVNKPGNIDQVISGLNPSTPYTIKVKAKSSSADGEWSGTINVTTSGSGSEGGTGTPLDPYIILNAAELDDVRNDLAASYRLGDDIDLNSAAFTPIGDSSTPFTGTLDGDGYTISNLTITDASDDAGLFGYTDGAALNNINIENVDITGDDYYYCTGALVGYANDTVIENCSVSGTGTVTGGNYTGGLIGRTNADVRDCYATVDVEGAYCVGGLIGQMVGNEGYDSSPAQRLGENERAVYQTVAPSGNLRDIFGQLAQADASLSREDLSYENVVELSDSYATGHVIGAENAGGFVGGLHAAWSNQISVRDCFAAGSVTSFSYAYAIGGFVGMGVIDRGGFIEVMNCYSACGVSEGAGGFAGEEYDLQISDCYFDSTVADAWNDWQAQARPTEDMKQESTFEGFDFNYTWSIDEDETYPYLQSLPNPFDSTPPTAPGPVVNVHYTAKTDTSVSLAWNSVSGATGYVVKRAGAANIAVQTNNCTVPNLSANTSYTFTVYATNAVDDGPDSAPFTVWTNLPAASGLQQTGATSTSVTVSWSALPGATAYDISKDNGLTFTPLGNVTTHTFPSLINSETYPVIVRGKNASTGGEWSDVLYAMPLAIRPVENLRCTAKTDTTVSLAWDAPFGATGYEVNDGTSTQTTNGTTWIAQNLTQDTPYLFKVRALYGQDASAWRERPVRTRATAQQGGGADISLNVELDKLYNVVLTASDIDSFQNRIFTVTYDPAKLQPVDFAAQTPAIDDSVDPIPDTDLTVESFTAGEIELSSSKTIENGKSFSGVLTIVKFRALANAASTQVTMTADGVSSSQSPIVTSVSVSPNSLSSAGGSVTVTITGQRLSGMSANDLMLEAPGIPSGSYTFITSNDLVFVYNVSIPPNALPDPKTYTFTAVLDDVWTGKSDSVTVNAT